MNDGRKTIHIILADDHELLRDGFRSLLKKLKDIHLIAEAMNGRQLLELVEKHEPDVVITDIKMPVLDGIAATKMIRQNYPSIKIIALSNYDEQDLITEMVQAGADGYLVKNATKKEIAEAITAVMNGKVYYCNTTSQKLLSHFNERPLARMPKEIKFTKRELEVMKLICKGYSLKEIGNELSISPRTVESHKESIEEKIGVKSAVSIAIFAVQNGYL